MYLRIRSDGPVSVHEADDCGRLHVTLDGVSEDDADAALRAAGLGRVSGPDHAWLDLAALRTRAEAAATEPGWPAAWDAMIAYAGTHGWLSPDNREVRAHIEQ
jgi:hypothetical protein